MTALAAPEGIHANIGMPDAREVTAQACRLNEARQWPSSRAPRPHRIKQGRIGGNDDERPETCWPKSIRWLQSASCHVIFLGARGGFYEDPFKSRSRTGTFRRCIAGLAGECQGVCRTLHL